MSIFIKNIIKKPMYRKELEKIVIKMLLMIVSG